MSLKALSLVWEDSRAEGVDLLVLLAMADWADAQGRCWPSYAQLADKARVSRRSAIRSVDRLVELGEITRVVHGRSPDPQDDDSPQVVRAQHRNQYQLVLKKPGRKVVTESHHTGDETAAPPADPQVVPTSHHPESQVVTATHAGGDIHDTQVVTSTTAHIRNRPSVRPSVEPSATAAAPAPAAGTVFGATFALDPAQPADALALAWNAHTGPPLPPVHSLTPKRRRLALARLAERPLETWREIFGRINRSAFCRGLNPRGFVASFAWVISAPDPGLHTLEGVYDSQAAAARAHGSVSGSTCPHTPRCSSSTACIHRVIDDGRRERGEPPAEWGRSA